MTIEDDIALLSRVPTFSALGRDALRVLAIGADSRSLQEGDILCQEGETSDAGFVVEEGMLAAHIGKNDSAPVLIGRGTLIGELSLLIDVRRPATITATEPSSVMRIPRALFIKMLEGYPEVAERMRQTLLERAERVTAELGAVRVSLDLNAPPAPLRRATDAEP